MDTGINAILSGLCSSSKLDRDKGIALLEQYCDAIVGQEMRELEEKFIDVLKDNSSSWESLHGILCGTKTYLLRVKNDVSQTFAENIIEQSSRCLENEESRVRLAIGEALGALCECKVEGLGSVWLLVQNKIFQGIADNILRNPDQLQEEAEKLAEKIFDNKSTEVDLKDSKADSLLHKEHNVRVIREGSQSDTQHSQPASSISGLVEADMSAASLTTHTSITPDLQESLDRQTDTASTPDLRSSSPRMGHSLSAEEVFHDTAGWRFLETYMKCLQEVVKGSGSNFQKYVDEHLLQSVFATLGHTNRFVRETGFYVIANIIKCCTDETECDPVVKFSDILARELASGLSDNWSQVRLAASVATRDFLENIQSENLRASVLPILLPPLCLNRYYVAEGVRLYSQETWRRLTQNKGKELVERYINETVKFYISQSEADNHAVREAACACIAELGQKVNKDDVRPYVPALLNALIVCFRDDSWPVRDASCIACGNFILSFPEESKSSLEVLMELFYGNLGDNIPSVREGAAAALANVCRAHFTWSSSRILKKITEGLEGVKDQSGEAERFSSLDKGPATYGVARVTDGSQAAVANQTMYSCGSLAPKMRAGGCMDHQFRRPSQPWEVADGCIHLTAEMSEIPAFASQMSEALKAVSKAVNVRHYDQHLQLLETLCRRLPDVAHGMGKRPFKVHLEQFIEPIFYSLRSDSPLTSTAATDCLTLLASFLGPSIVRGRIENYDATYVMDYDRCVGMPHQAGSLGQAPLFPPRLDGPAITLPPFMSRGAPLRPALISQPRPPLPGRGSNHGGAL